MKPGSDVLGRKIWLNSKYIKKKQNQKLKVKFLRSFYILNLVKNQVYKLELSAKWQICIIFHISLLEQIIKKGKLMNLKCLSLKLIIVKNLR